MKQIALCLCLFVSTVATAENFPMAAPAEFTADQLRMHELHTAHRLRRGLAAQRLDAGLCRQAQRLAEAQAAAGSMFHSSWGWQENVAHGAGPEGSIAMWINSAPHNANLLCGQPCVGFGISNGHSAAVFGPSYEGEDLSVSASSGGSGGSANRRRGFFRRR